METELDITNTFKKCIKLINEYLNLIIIAPAILGGLWQLIELIKISPSFIRFFSVTQIVADGLLALFILLIAFPITFFLVRKIIENDKELIDEGKITPSPRKALMYFVLTIVMIFSIAFSNQFIQDKAHILLRILIFIPINLFLFLICVSFILRAYEYSPKKNEESLRFVRGYTVFVFFVQIIILWNFLKDIHNEFYLPKGLQNVEYIKCKLNITDSKESYRLLYFNDKFIFLETKRRGVKILKFDEFLNDENCK